MTQQVTLNGNTYSDDGTVGKGMAEGGFRDNLVPMLSDCIVDIDGAVSDAEGQAVQAANSAAAAALAAATVVTGPGSNGSSTTSLTIGMGVQNLVIQPGKTIPVGAPTMIASTVSPDNWMHGTALAYNSATGALQVNVKNIGVVTPGVYPTLAAWTVSLSGPAAVTGLLNELKGAPVASAATINLDATTGNLVHLTGSVPITAITLAQGSARTVIVDAAPLLTNGASLVLPGGDNIQAAAGDTFTVRGDGGGKSVVVHYTRAARAPLVGMFRNAEVLTTSQVWTAKITGLHRLTLVGANGSGGVALALIGGGVLASGAAASGAGAGAVGIKLFNAIAGDSYVFTFGSPGAGVTVNAGTPGAASAGNDAGDSTVTGPGVSLTAGGGKKGNAAISSTAGAVATAASAPGGVSTGGDINIPGGASGTASATANASGNAASTGGGACGYKGVGYSSGAATANRAGAAAAASSGGAGVGGASGSASATTTNAASGAGGSLGPSANASNVSNAAGGVGLDPTFAAVLNVAPLNLVGVGGNGSTTTVGTSGAGSAGNPASNSGAVALLAGSGGASRIVSSSTTVVSGSVALGGGSGGVAVASSSNNPGPTTSGDGGAAFAIIETV